MTSHPENNPGDTQHDWYQQHGYPMGDPQMSSFLGEGNDTQGTWLQPEDHSYEALGDSALQYGYDQTNASEPDIPDSSWVPDYMPAAHQFELNETFFNVTAESQYPEPMRPPTAHTTGSTLGSIVVNSEYTSNVHRPMPDRSFSSYGNPPTSSTAYNSTQLPPSQYAYSGSPYSYMNTPLGDADQPQVDQVQNLQRLNDQDMVWPSPQPIHSSSEVPGSQNLGKDTEQSAAPFSAANPDLVRSSPSVAKPKGETRQRVRSTRQMSYDPTKVTIRPSMAVWIPSTNLDIHWSSSTDITMVSEVREKIDGVLFSIKIGSTCPGAGEKSCGLPNQQFQHSWVKIGDVVKIKRLQLSCLSCELKGMWRLPICTKRERGSRGSDQDGYSCNSWAPIIQTRKSQLNILGRCEVHEQERLDADRARSKRWRVKQGKGQEAV